MRRFLVSYRSIWEDGALNDDEDAITSGMALAVLDEQADATIRRAEINRVWYFSIIDVVAILTDSPTPRRYWAELKRKLRDEGSEVFAKGEQLKLTAADGKQRTTDAADLETVLRIIQSVPSPKAEPIKLWLARVGSYHLEAANRPVEIPVPAPTTPIGQSLDDRQTGRR